jgi:hypothetical protein
MTGLLSTILAALLAAPPSDPCGGAELQARMAHVLYDNPEYREFVCGDRPCTEAGFLEGLEFREESLRDQPPVRGCFVEPARKAENFHTGFFILRGVAAELQLTFFGSGIGVDRRARGRGYKLVTGTERREADQWIRTTYRWNGARYVQIATRAFGPD